MPVSQAVAVVLAMAEWQVQEYTLGLSFSG